MFGLDSQIRITKMFVVVGRGKYSRNSIVLSFSTVSLVLKLYSKMSRISKDLVLRRVYHLIIQPQVPITRSAQLSHITVTPFSQTDLFLV